VEEVVVLGTELLNLVEVEVRVAINTILLLL
jgi:hypothetical protein